MNKCLIYFSILCGLCLYGCTPSVNLSQNGTANCYIVSKAGNFRFDASHKGNSGEPTYSGEYAEVLWESFGTEQTPQHGELIESASFNNGHIDFTVPKPFRKGNAVIALKDGSGVILWSWHIWLTDMPKEQKYSNGAGTMMDRNLGAVSNEFGHGYGLEYFWGRKDPFLPYRVQATAAFPEGEMTSKETGTIEYSIKNPMTPIYDGEYEDSFNLGYWEWKRTKDLWGSDKTMYDPCPVGWRVPDASLWIESLQLKKHRELVYGNNYAEYYDDVRDILDGDSNLYQLYKHQQDDNIWYPMGTYWSVSNDLTLQLAGNRATINPTDPSYKSSIRCQKIE